MGLLEFWAIKKMRELGPDLGSSGQYSTRLDEETLWEQSWQQSRREANEKESERYRELDEYRKGQKDLDLRAKTACQLLSDCLRNLQDPKKVISENFQSIVDEPKYLHGHIKDYLRENLGGCLTEALMMGVRNPSNAPAVSTLVKPILELLERVPWLKSNRDYLLWKNSEVIDTLDQLRPMFERFVSLLPYEKVLEFCFKDPFELRHWLSDLSLQNCTLVAGTTVGQKVLCQIIRESPSYFDKMCALSLLSPPEALIKNRLGEISRAELADSMKKSYPGFFGALKRFRYAAIVKSRISALRLDLAESSTD